MTFMETNISQQLGVFRENKIIESKLELVLESFDKNRLGRGGFSSVEIFRVWVFRMGIFLDGNVSVENLLVGNWKLSYAGAARVGFFQVGVFWVRIVRVGVFRVRILFIFTWFQHVASLNYFRIFLLKADSDTSFQHLKAF